MTPVEDPADPRLADYAGLTDVALRRRLEPAGGLFMAEGEKVIRRALDAGHPMRSMLLTPRWVETMSDLITRTEAPVHVVSPELAEAVTGYHVHRGALAAMGRLPLPEAGTLLSGARRVVVLEAVNDHTNIGAVFRSAAALGMDAVLLSPDCADPLYRRSVKVSMGAVFSLPYARLTGWPAGLATVADAGFRLLALTPDPAAADLAEAVADAGGGRLALMLGAEGDGLTERAMRASHERVRIPMAHGIDSLNVAAAAAVACYALGSTA
ncbi:RNA methyltransferase [Streptomyces sedi]|uniref:RNA methyltransferase n=1 Tax=Streptomyces sedi TaxID=555059 RepID=A0A5C4UV67_9ACTN|nr:RNA methyltransferase [Streptomyces sedi]